MNTSPQVYLASLETGYHQVVETALDSLGFFDRVPAGGTVFLKPNLTYPEYRPGVMTSFVCLEAIVECLSGRGFQVVIGEADSGGYNRFAMEEVFERMGIDALAERTGARLVNLSFAAPLMLPVHVGRRRLEVPVPRILLEDIDAFITLPVPKIHMNTRVSMAIKNQWGCIQEPAERLKLHPDFAPVMYELNRRLPRAYAIIDGRYGLNRSGPMKGDVVDLNWLLASDDLVAADRVCCRLMQVDERRVGHLQFFRRKGWWTPYEAIRLNRDPAPFVRDRFYLHRKWTDYPGLACFHSRSLAWLGYRSPLAGVLHRLLYLFRESFYDYDKVKSQLAQRSHALPAPAEPEAGGKHILGMRVDATSYEEAGQRILRWAGTAESRYVCVSTVHMTMEAYDSDEYRRVVNEADLVTPDGMPMVWSLRLLGHRDQRRVYGPDLMVHVLAASARDSVPVGFYGGRPDVLERLLVEARRRFPGLVVAYAESPPFAPLGEAERRATVDAINASGARILFVGLGCPKQERWMAEHRDHIPAVMVGVGAAFDFLAGTTRQAPRWVMAAGFEWLFRLVTEPRRLWRRYLKHNPRFVALFSLQVLRLRAFESLRTP